jgi:Zn-dependent protease with chaperone function
MIEFSATYYDGHSSRPSDVRVRLDDANVLHVVGSGVAVSHALATVQIAPRLGNTVCALALPDGGKCETHDNDAVDTLRVRAGHGRRGTWVHALESRWRTALAATLVLAVGIAAGLKWGVPLAAKQIAHALPAALAYDLGRGTLVVLDKTLFEPSELPEPRRAELTRAFREMAKQYPDLPLRLTFREGAGANAFALPGGTVVVTDDLVKLADADAQILSVLAHEIGHVHHRHSLRMALESSSVAAVVAAYFGDTTQITTLSAALPAVYAQAHYSREHETEADTFALAYLQRAQIAPHHFSDILRKLQQSHGGEREDPLQYLASHPPTSERVRRFDVGRRR